MAYIKNNDDVFSVEYDGQKIIWNGQRHATEEECADIVANQKTPEELEAIHQARLDAIAKRETDKTNAKAKLIAGEALTEEEANTIVL
jgi:DNA-binding FadR family transcriptional regulator